MTMFVNLLPMSSCSASLVPCSMSWQHDGELHYRVQHGEWISFLHPGPGAATPHDLVVGMPTNAPLSSSGGEHCRAWGPARMDGGKVSIQTIKSVQVNHLLLLHTSSLGLLPVS